MAKRDRPANPFAEVDQTPPAVAVLLVEVLRQMAANPEIQRVRALALDALRVHPGQRLLDAAPAAVKWPGNWPPWWPPTATWWPWTSPKPWWPPPGKAPTAARSFCMCQLIVVFGHEDDRVLHGYQR